jgi:cytochrome c biogenesis protein CcdA
VAFLVGIWFVVLLPSIEWRAFFKSLRSVASFLLFFALALVGMLWADGPLSEKLQGMHPVGKLLAIPFLLYHFSRFCNLARLSPFALVEREIAPRFDRDEVASDQIEYLRHVRAVFIGLGDLVVE